MFLMLMEESNLQDLKDFKAQKDQATNLLPMSERVILRLERKKGQ